MYMYIINYNYICKYIFIRFQLREIAHPSFQLCLHRRRWVPWDGSPELLTTTSLAYALNRWTREWDVKGRTSLKNDIQKTIKRHQMRFSIFRCQGKMTSKRRSKENDKGAPKTSEKWGVAKSWCQDLVRHVEAATPTPEVPCVTCSPQPSKRGWILWFQTDVRGTTSSFVILQ